MIIAERLDEIEREVAELVPSSISAGAPLPVARALARVAEAVARAQVLVLAAASATGALRADGAVDLAAWFRAHGTSGSRARVLADAARAAATAPVHEALVAGRLCVEHAAALLRVCDLVRRERCELGEVLHLLAIACSEPIEAFRDRVRATVIRIMGDDGAGRRERAKVTEHHTDDGMGVFRSELPPEDHAVVRTALDALVDTAWRAGHAAGTAPSTRELPSLRAAAIVEMARRSLHGASSPTRARRAGAEVIVIVDADTFASGELRPESVCRLADGTPLPGAVARQVAERAGRFRPVVRAADCALRMAHPVSFASYGLGASGHGSCRTASPTARGPVEVALDHGRQVRLATFEQYLALLVRGPTCEFVDCTVPAAWCKAHHLWWWERGGPTDLENLALLCERHHHLVHEGGWTLIRRGGVTLTVRPDGRVCPAAGVRDRGPGDVVLAAGDVAHRRRVRRTTRATRHGTRGAPS